jgi:hypothetical protein
MPTSSAPRPDLKIHIRIDAAGLLPVVPPSPNTIRRRKSTRRSEEHTAIRGVTLSLNWRDRCRLEVGPDLGLRRWLIGRGRERASSTPYQGRSRYRRVDKRREVIPASQDFGENGCLHSPQHAAIGFCPDVSTPPT